MVVFWCLVITQSIDCFSFFNPGKIVVTIGDYLILNSTKEYKTLQKVEEITIDVLQIKKQFYICSVLPY